MKVSLSSLALVQRFATLQEENLTFFVTDFTGRKPDYQIGRI